MIREVSPGCLEATCDYCKKPLVKANEFGIFCEDNCGLEHAQAMKKEVLALIQLFLPKEEEK